MTRRKRLARRRRRATWRHRLESATYAVAGAVSVVGGVGLLARLSHPGTEWVPQLAAPALPLLGPLALPLAVVAGAFAVRKRHFWGGAATLALVAFLSTWALRTSAPASADQGPLRVATLNLGASSGKEAAVEDYVSQTQPHLLLFQEAAVHYGPYAPAVGRVATLDGYAVYVDSTSVGEPRRQVLVSRLPVRSYEAGYLGATEDHAGVYSRAVVDWRGADVAVYNVHLRPFNPTVGWSLGRALSPAVWAETPQNLDQFFSEQAVEGEALARMVARETLPVIVGGDFNSTPDQWSRSVVGRTLREVTGRWGPAATRPAGIPLANVDGIQVSGAWGVESAGVGPSGLSDHRPVSAALSLGPRPDPAASGPSGPRGR